MNDLVLVITLKGRPYALPRARHIPGRKRPVSITGKPKLYARALERVAHGVVSDVGCDAVRQAFAGVALSVSAVWVFPTPDRKRWGLPHTYRPDKDNLEKLLLDCLMRAGALGGDDAKVAAGRQIKQWGPTGWLAVEIRPVGEAGISPVRKKIQDKLSAPPEWLR